MGEKYEIVRLLGQGGMGAVFLARDRALERAVAIKVLVPGDEGADALERFRREARTAARLQHPGIVPLHAFGEHDGLRYFAMGYVRGESLGARLQREGTMDPEAVRAILSQVADALDHAHRLGIVHRDIKPDNILLDDETGRAHLTDFGIARAESVASQRTALTQVGIAVGTPQFMSPEQATGERDVDGRSDLYSLGVMAYLLLSGRLPFTGTSARELLMQHVTQAPRPLAEVAPQVPDDLAAVVMRCLEKDPQRRFPDARALRAALGSSAGDAALALELQELSGSGAWVVLLLLIAAVGGGTAFAHGREILGMRWLGWLVVPFSASLGFGAQAAAAARRGHAWRSVMRAFWTQPAWWPVWWPRALRRASDVSARIPPDIRTVRALYSLVWLALLVEGPLLVGVTSPRQLEQVLRVPMTTSEFQLRWLGQAGVAGGLLLLLAFLLLFVAIIFGTNALAGRIAPRYGLTRQDILRLAYRGTASPVWQDARYEPILLRGAGRVRAPATPAETPTAITELARSLPTSAAAAGADAARVARRLVSALDGITAQVAKLEQSAGLLAGEPELLAQVERRFALLNERRNLIANQLRELWDAAAELRRPQAADGAGGAPTGRLRVLAETFDRELDASPVTGTTSAVLPGVGA